MFCDQQPESGTYAYRCAKTAVQQTSVQGGPVCCLLLFVIR